MSKTTMERRATPGRVELREDGDGAPSIAGLAAVYYREDDPGTEFELWSGAVERIHPGAFSRAIREGDDARALFNHDPDNLLGRRSAKTLELEDTPEGLSYRISPSEGRLYSDVVEMVRRGDLDGSSFSFVPTDVDWSVEDETEVRNIRGVRLFDVGPVTFPAYPATTAGIRAGGDALEAIQAERRAALGPDPRRHQKRTRARLVEMAEGQASA